MPAALQQHWLMLVSIKGCRAFQLAAVLPR
jgi:hypothetical protein